MNYRKKQNPKHRDFASFFKLQDSLYSLHSFDEENKNTGDKGGLRMLIANIETKLAYNVIFQITLKYILHMPRNFAILVLESEDLT